MASIKLYFLGDEYTIPSELQEFVAILQEFEKYNESLTPLLLSLMKKGDWHSGADDDFVYFRKPMINVANKVILKLSKHNIFDVTVPELVDNNKGYIKLHKLCSNTMEGMKQILIDAITDFENGYERAYTSAASQVTGSGISIWTNSLSSAMLYSAMEASTVKKQCNQAEKQYQAALDSLCESNADTQKRRENDLLVKTYYPGVAESLSLFISCLMETYIDKLFNKGIFDYSKIQNYNLQRSSELLKNISLISDKVGILKQAFEYCPYNPDIYQKVLECSLADYETFKTAQYFMQDQVLLSYIEEYCRTNVKDYERIAIIAKIWAVYKNCDEKEILFSLYRNEVEHITNKYKLIKLAIANRKSLVNWIKDSISQDATDLLAISNENLHGKIEEQILMVVSEKQYSMFYQLGLIMVEQIALTDSTATKLADINTEIINKMFEMIKEYIAELFVHKEKCIEDAEKMKKEYNDAMSVYKQELQKMKTTVDELQNQRQSLGVFAFSKKKELDQRIHNERSKRDAYEKEHNPDKMKKAYENMLKEAGTFV